MNQSFTLYHLPTCPYCLKVRREAAKLGVELDLVDVSRDVEARAKVIEETGRATVPVLRIPLRDEPRFLPESSDIVAFLRRWASLNASEATL